MKTKTILLIHGMFMTPRCWEKWIPYYESKGYRVLAPAWPGRDQPVELLNKMHPDPALPKLKVGDIVEHMTGVIKGLGEKPAIIGHSMGGLVVQILLNRGLVSAAVAIDPAPPMGVFTTQWSFIKSNFPAINPFLLGKPAMMTFEHFQYAFANTLTADEQHAAYDRYMVPESRNVPVSSLGTAGRVDFSRAHAPLLITAGEMDNIVPAGLNLTNYKRYKNAASVTDFHVFAGRDHTLTCSARWQEVADFSLSWLEKQNI